MAQQVLVAGRSYTLELIPKTTLTGGEMERGINLLRERVGDLKRDYGVEVSELTFKPDKVTVTFKAGLMIQPIPIIVYAIIALLSIVGIAIIWWKISEVVPPIPWEMVLPVAALGFLAIIVYAIGR